MMAPIRRNVKKAVGKKHGQTNKQTLHLYTQYLVETAFLREMTRTQIESHRCETKQDDEGTGRRTIPPKN